MDTFSRMRATSLPVLAGAALLALSGAALSAPILVGTTSDPTGIDDLVIDGTTYDVTFSTSSFDSTFTYGTAASTDATSAIRGALNSLGVVGLGGVSGVDDLVLIENDLAFPGDGVANTQRGFGWESAGGYIGFPLGLVDNNFTEAAHFSAVPEPATLALIAAGLLGLGLSRRRLAR